MRVWTVMLLALGAVSSPSCAPSHRLVHDGNVYFERCYGSDFNPRIDPKAKEACWNAWLAHYTRHQPEQRVDYAMRRVEALQSGEPSPELPSISGEHPKAAPGFMAAELITLQGPQAGAEASTILAKGAEPEKPIPNGCADVCGKFESECLGRCTADNEDCKTGCTRERQICLGGCY